MRAGAARASPAARNYAAGNLSSINSARTTPTTAVVFRRKPRVISLHFSQNRSRIGCMSVPWYGLQPAQHVGVHTSIHPDRPGQNAPLARQLGDRLGQQLDVELEAEGGHMA